MERTGMQPLFMFMNSGLNVELVYVILTGISTHFKSKLGSDIQSDPELFKDSLGDGGQLTMRTVTRSNGDKDKVVTMKNFVIEDIDKWRDIPNENYQMDIQ